METVINNSAVQNNFGIIQKIKNFGGIYDPNSPLSIDDQLFISEMLPYETHPITSQVKNDSSSNGNVSVNDRVSGTYKNGVNFLWFEGKENVISKLNSYNSKTPPIIIAGTLEELFFEFASKSTHWLFIAQNYTPRVINRIINYMIKSSRSGQVTIQNPSAYFTHLSKFRRKRKELIGNRINP